MTQIQPQRGMRPKNTPREAPGATLTACEAWVATQHPDGVARVCEAFL